MARREDRVVIEREGRDKGKVFWITEMSAMAAEYFAGRLLTILAAGNTSVPPGFFRMGFEGAAAWVAVHGLGGINWNLLQPLLAEQLSCIAIQPDPTKNVRRALTENDIEEPATLLFLREAWFDTHLGFSIRQRYWNWTTDTSDQTSQNGPNIATFPTTAQAVQSVR